MFNFPHSLHSHVRLHVCARVLVSILSETHVGLSTCALRVSTCSSVLHARVSQFVFLCGGRVSVCVCFRVFDRCICVCLFT